MKMHILALAVLLGVPVALPTADGNKTTDPGFVVHEWGTFTGVQGTDGVQMFWQPGIAEELPKFVYDVARPTARPARLQGIKVAGKTGTACRQRMETPVIYFYSEQARTVDVAVRFPEGRITEWYPLENANHPEAAEGGPAGHQTVTLHVDGVTDSNGSGVTKVAGTEVNPVPASLNPISFGLTGSILTHSQTAVAAPNVTPPAAADATMILGDVRTGGITLNTGVAPPRPFGAPAEPPSVLVGTNCATIITPTSTSSIHLVPAVTVAVAPRTPQLELSNEITRTVSCGSVTTGAASTSSRTVQALQVAVAPAKEPATPPALLWKNVQVLPQSAPSQPLITDPSGSHYYAARATDASLVRTSDHGKSETEKFLFYRGTGEFQTPLVAKLDRTDPSQLSLTNSGPEALQSLFICEVRADGRVAWTPLDNLAAGATQTARLGSATFTDDGALKAALRAALVRQGLYEKEAAAMVDTWGSSWLGDPGVRVLYTLPRSWTDRTLPLTITPAPKALDRVMVGRAEIITPAMEQALLTAVNRYIASTVVDRPKIVAETRALGLGRFTEPVLRRLFASASRDSVFISLSLKLLEASMAPPIEVSSAN